MRFCWSGLVALVIMAPASGFAVSCTTQAELAAQDRGTLASIGEQLSDAVIRQDTSALQAVLLPSLANQWEGIRGAIEQAAPMVKGGKTQLRNVYLLDASSLATPTDTQFFCSNANGTMTVTISMRGLPPGRYAIVLSVPLWPDKWDLCLRGIRLAHLAGSSEDFRDARECSTATMECGIGRELANWRGATCRGLHGIATMRRTTSIRIFACA